MPSAWRPSIGSCALQLPKLTKSSRASGDLVGSGRRARASESDSAETAKRLGILVRERLLLVAEDSRGEQVQKAVLVAVAKRLVEPGRRLERNLEPAARLDEARRASARSAGPSRRSEPSPGARARRAGGSGTRRRRAAAARSRPPARRRRAPRGRARTPRRPRSVGSAGGSAPVSSTTEPQRLVTELGRASRPGRRSGSRSSRCRSPARDGARPAPRRAAAPPAERSARGRSARRRGRAAHLSAISCQPAVM